MDGILLIYKREMIFITSTYNPYTEKNDLQTIVVLTLILLHFQRSF